MSHSKCALEILFDYLYRKQFQNIEELLPQVRSDYKKRLQELTTEEKRKVNYIKSLLEYCKQERWTQANNQLEPAEEEYHRYFLRNMPKSGYYQLHGSHQETIHPGNGAIGKRNETNVKGVSWTDGDQTAQKIVSRNTTPSKPRSGNNDARHANSVQSSIKQKFESLYRLEWSESMKELIHLKICEKLAAQCLFRILLDAYKVCKIEAENQISKLEDAAYHIMLEGTHDTGEVVRGNRACLLEYRKGISDICIEKLQESFRRRFLPEIIRSIGIYQNIRTHGPVHVYTNQCVSLCWYMVVQDPPLYFRDDRDSQEPFNNDWYNTYTNSGPSVDFYALPPLFTCKDGQLLSKGLAQGR